jgi:hypothetical protein
MRIQLNKENNSRNSESRKHSLRFNNPSDAGDERSVNFETTRVLFNLGLLKGLPPATFRTRPSNLGNFCVCSKRGERLTPIHSVGY